MQPVIFDNDIVIHDPTQLFLLALHFAYASCLLGPVGFGWLLKAGIKSVELEVVKNGGVHVARISAIN